MARSPDLATGPRGLRAGHGSAKLIGDLRSGKWAGSGDPRRRFGQTRAQRFGQVGGVRRPAPSRSARLIGDLRSGKWAGSGDPRPALGQPAPSASGKWAGSGDPRPALGQPAPSASDSRRGQETRAQRFGQTRARRDPRPAQPRRALKTTHDSATCTDYSSATR